ncbi:DUF1593 domain-containing protein [Sphingobium sp. Sx8-8]|uniref:DUF1593 domain-containing protein n=1 Tax=Sphingobium sp. Sx8-8 TaxID=2933617 RepID=UPI001F599FD4|nr:DUF1593 domain-containing protein [Sphingobium sp. Sx8-8]
MKLSHILSACSLFALFTPLPGYLAQAAQPQAPTAALTGQTEDFPRYDIRPRLIVITDIANEPDDEASLVRLLLYADSLDIQGLIASTSIWMRDAVHPEKIEERVRAYGAVLPNLRVHSPGYPSMESLLSRISSGEPRYGMAAVGEGHDSDGSRAIIAAADKASDDRPLWISIWGGANVLAQALWRVSHDRSPQEVANFVARLRVYSISDQDDSGPWLRQTFPKLFWITSLHAFNHYERATWTGISGEAFYKFEGGPNSRLVSKEWLTQNIIKGPLGSLYPLPAFIMEGDTPAFLYLIPNGLGVPEAPDFGSWGGRYGRLGAGQDIWTDVTDTAMGQDGRLHSEAQASIWRWRDAYQGDFAARIQWSLASRYKDANHPPIIRIDRDRGMAPIARDMIAGQKLKLDLSGTRDPDGDTISLSCWQYKEPSTTSVSTARVPNLLIEQCTDRQIVLTAPAVKAPILLHLIVEARDDAHLAMRSYRRVIVRLAPG